MRMTLIGLIAGAAALAAAVPPASAATIDLANSQLNGLAVTDLSRPGQLAFDASIREGNPLSLRVVLEAGDLGAPLAFEASLSNADFLRNLGGLTLSLAGATFASFGDVTPFFSAVQSSSLMPSSLSLTFSSPGEPAGVDLGGVAPFAGRDFTIGTTGRAAGDAFALSIQVPEPASMTLMLGALLGLAGLSRRQV